MMSLEMLKGLRYVGYPEDCLMLADGTVLCEFSTGRARMERSVKDSCGKAIAEAVAGCFLESKPIPSAPFPESTENEPIKRGRGRPPKVK